MDNPPVVVPCHKKIDSLKRLLHSLLKAKYPNGVTIVFSIDYSGKDDVVNCIRSFDWPYGNKEMIIHEKNIGLRENIISCGELSKKYGSVIILEDDIYVSRDFYLYALNARNFYAHDTSVAGISLYAYEYSEVARERFYPLYDGKDTFFMQWPSSWGQLWTASQWSSFFEWYRKHRNEDLSAYNVPEKVINWPESSWKKYYVAYLVDSGKFFVYPYVSFTSNCADEGFHCVEASFIDKQVSIPLGFDISSLNFANSSSLIKYDSFFQIYPECLQMNHKISRFDFDVDLAGTKRKRNVTKEYLISSKRCKKPIFSFDSVLIPLPLNIIDDCNGGYLSLGKVNDFCHREDLFYKVFKSRVNRELATPANSVRFVISRILKKLGFKSPFATRS